jgi:Sulfotransferase domain
MKLVTKDRRRVLAGVARSAAQPLAMATAPLRLLPDFLIVGAQRAGTTSLYNYLVQHPDVGRVRLGKGVHYFDTNPTESTRWYRSHFPLDPAAVRVRRRPHHVGEGAPYYLFHPLALERATALLPDVKLVAILRDPVERAHSQWVHETARGYEELPFLEALMAESDRLAGEDERLRTEPGAYSFSHQHHSYVARGLYATQIERMCELVGRERVFICSSKRLFAKPDEVFHEVLQFLGLSPCAATYEVHNSRSYPPLDPDVEAWLEAHFAASNERLVELLGAEFDFRRG